LLLVTTVCFLAGYSTPRPSADARKQSLANARSWPTADRQIFYTSVTGLLQEPVAQAHAHDRPLMARSSCSAMLTACHKAVIHSQLNSVRRDRQLWAENQTDTKRSAKQKQRPGLQDPVAVFKLQNTQKPLMFMTVTKQLFRDNKVLNSDNHKSIG
jgi:hypothetical protein